MGDILKEHKRHRRAYGFFKFIVRPFFNRSFNFHPEPANEIEGPFLLLANHNLDFDPVIINFSFKHLIYFVASEHIFRIGLASWFLKRYFAPISRLKGTADIGTVKEILKRLRAGMRVCIFAEGNRSFNGLTGTIPKSTGRLAKTSGVPLITYRFEGGYLTMPRWAYTKRRGRMRGHVVNVYTVEDLAQMSSEDINAAIATDLFEDAYARQAVERLPYKGKRLAEGLEHSLFICPSCEQIGSLHSEGDRYACACGLEVRYDEYGYLSGGPFDTVTLWDQWQHKRLIEIARTAGEDDLFADMQIKLCEILPEHRSELIYTGEVSMNREGIKCGKLYFKIEDIPSMQIYGRSTLTFNYGRTHYEIAAPDRFCGRKYLELYNFLRSETNGASKSG